MPHFAPHRIYPTESRFMLCQVLLLVATILTTTASAYAQDSSPSNPCGDRGQDGYLVKFKTQFHTQAAATARRQANTLRSMNAESKFAFSGALAGLHFVQSTDMAGSSPEAALRSNSQIEYVVPNCRIQAFDTGYTVAGFVRGNAGNNTDGRLSLVYGAGEGLSITKPDTTTTRVNIPSKQLGPFFLSYRPRELTFQKLLGSPFSSIAAATMVETIGNGGSSSAAGLSIIGNDQGSLVPLVDMSGLDGVQSIFSPMTAMGDLSGDGIDDVVWAAPNGSSTQVKVSFSETPLVWGNATFNGHSGKVFAVPSYGNKPAYLVSRSGAWIGQPQVVEVAPYLGNRLFGPPSTVLNLNSAQQISVGDLNGNGSPDIAVVSSEGLRVYMNDGSWNLALTDGWNFGNSGLTSPEVTVADLDNDGQNDIIIVDEGAAVVFRNVGGTFPTYSWIPLNNGDSSFELDDIDRDGYLDIVFTDLNRLVFPAYNTTAATRSANPGAPDAFKFEIDTSYQFVLPSTPFGARGMDPLGVWGTQVTLRSASNPSFVRQIRTDRNGQFTFKKVPAGQYTLTLQDPTLLLRTTSMSINVTGNTAGLAVFGRSDFLPAQIPAPSVSAISRTNDPAFDLLWGLHNGGQSGGISDVDMNIPEAWRFTKGDPSVVVAVLDSGVDINHPDLKANISFNPGSATQAGYNTVDNNSVMIPSMHGTHVSGTIAAVADNGV
ncbi:MAG: hypothetical protein EBZ48_11005, partial [Proteobacteria bacterium]|nr:hypothetical protein [Pseudomonadota bacterium]